jgi:flagellar FliL protein
MAKKEKAKKPDAPEADKPAVEGEEGAVAKKKMAGKTLVLFIILPAVLVLGGGGAAAMMLLGGGAPAAAAESHGEEEEGDAEAEEGHGEAKAEDHGGDKAAAGEHGAEGEAAAGEAGDVGRALECHGDDPCYYTMPKLIVNLAGAEGQRSPYMELELTLESSSSATFKRVPDLMPRLKDQLTSFLRELRVEDLNGSTGTWRLRRELLNRFNTVMDPKKVDAVLIESMLIQ